MPVPALGSHRSLLYEDANTLGFFVHHPGPGLDGEPAAVFHPGWRSKQPSYRGAALGFAIARDIVDAHGGTIWAEGKPGGRPDGVVLAAAAGELTALRRSSTITDACPPQPWSRTRAP